MPTTDRLFDRGTRLGERRLRDLGQEFRDKRLQIGLSQLAVAKAARISRSSYSRIEAGKRHSLTLLVAARIGVILGLDLSVKPYPGGEPLRDAASARLIKFVCDHVALPIRARTEVPLPQRTDHPEQRRWDVMLSGADKRTGMEVEMRLYDAQAQRGRWALKVRDDPVDSFVVIVADTGRNREVLEPVRHALRGPAAYRSSDILEDAQGRAAPAYRPCPPPKCAAGAPPGEDSLDLRLDKGRTRRRPATSTLEPGP